MASSRSAKRAERRLRQSDLVGTVTHGRLGLGSITRARWKNATDDLRRELVQSERCGNRKKRIGKLKQSALKRKEAGSVGKAP